MNVDIRKICIILFLVSCVTYWSTFWFDFAVDDWIHVTSNPNTQSITGGLRSFLEPTYPGNLYRPIVALSYSVTYALIGFEPWGYHLTNILLNAGVVVLLFLLLAHIFELQTAGWVAILFAVHPLHVEAVSNVHGRTELLSAFFMFLSLCLALYGTTAGTSEKDKFFRHACIGVTYLLALLSKESALVGLILFPVILLVSKSEPRQRMSWILSFIPASMAYFLLRYSALGSITGLGSIDFVDNPLASLSIYDRILVALPLIGKYASLCLIPYPLSADYSFSVLQGDDQLMQIVLGLMLTAVVLYGLTYIRGDKERAFGVLWFLGALAITANVLFPIGTIFGERLAYVPSAGILAVVVIEVQQRFSRTIAELLLLGLLLLASGYSIVHSYVWRNDNTLYSYQEHISNRSIKTLTNLAVIKRNQGDFDTALELIRSALAIYPSYAPSYFVRATIFERQGDLQKATEALDATLHIEPGNLSALYLLGVINFNQNNTIKAKEIFQHIVLIDSNNVDGLRGLLMVAVREKKQDEIRMLRDKMNSLAPGDSETRKIFEELKLT